MSTLITNSIYIHRFDFDNVKSVDLNVSMDDLLTKKIANFIKEIDFGKDCIDLISKGYHGSSETIYINATQVTFKPFTVHEGIVLLANKQLTDEQIKKLFEDITSSSPKLTMQSAKYEIKEIVNPGIKGWQCDVIPITKFPIPLLTPGPLYGKRFGAWTQSFKSKDSFEWLKQQAPTNCYSYNLTDSAGVVVHTFGPR